MTKTARAHAFSHDPRPSEEISELHGEIEPFEVYKSDPIEADLECRIADKLIRMRLPVWRISPLGVELALPKGDSALEPLSQGQKVNLHIKLRGQTVDFQGLVLNSTHSQNDQRLLGIRWFSDPDTRTIAEAGKNTGERRKSDRWACEKDFMPVGISPNPARFSDFVQFKVIDISATGMLLATSLRNRSLIPGMTLDASVIFPMCSQLNIRFRIVHTRVGNYDGRQVLYLGVTMVKPDRKLLSSIGQYIFQFGPPTSIELLKKQGLKVDHISRGIEFGYVRTEPEYLEVLALRKHEWQGADKLAPDVPVETFADLHDTRARILTARYRGQLVASVRLLFPEMGDKFELQEHVELPAKFPPYYATAELSRLSIQNDFLQSDLFYTLIRRAFLTAAQAKRKWMCTFTAPNLVPLYRRIGAKPTGIRFQHKGLGGREQVALLWDMPRVLAGYGVNPFVWNAIISDMTEYVREHDSIEFGPFMILRSMLYRCLRPLTPLFLRNRPINRG